MILSTKGRYGLKSMFEIAKAYESQKPLSIKSISERSEISENYLEQLLSKLKREGYLTSVRGAYGGYRLAKPPCEIYVGDILRVLEGELAPSPCTVENVCDTVECPTKKVWMRMKHALDDVMDSITLDDMLRNDLDPIMKNRLDIEENDE